MTHMIMLSISITTTTYYCITVSLILSLYHCMYYYHCMIVLLCKLCITVLLIVLCIVAF